MNDGKQRKAEDKRKDTDDRELERLHRRFFGHASEEWDAFSSLDQPSFLKQIRTRGDAHTVPIKGSPSRHED